MIYLTLALWPWVLGALAAGMVIGWNSGRAGDTTLSRPVDRDDSAATA